MIGDTLAFASSEVEIRFAQAQRMPIESASAVD
jgi:hypothetical protein